jgi:non-ribosomal peptide synthetase component F
VKDTTLAAFSHQELPFEQVVEAVQPVRSLSHSPLFQTMLSLNNTPEGGELPLPGLTLAPVDSGDADAHFDLSLHLTDAGDVISGAISYASALFDASTVARWAGHFMTLLEAMVADDARTTGALPLLSGHERERLLRDFNDTAAAYPDTALVHEVFEAQVAAQPDAVAVVCEDQRLTYSELNARANQLAHYLIGQGVKADDRVAICVERSLDLIVGLLGILKAGAGYLPLDPANPAERLAWMLEDSDCRLLLTQSEI